MIAFLGKCLRIENQFTAPEYDMPNQDKHDPEFPRSIRSPLKRKPQRKRCLRVLVEILTEGKALTEPPDVLVMMPKSPKHDKRTGGKDVGCTRNQLYGDTGNNTPKEKRILYR